MIYSENEGINQRRSFSTPLYPIEELNSQKASDFLMKKLPKFEKNSLFGELKSQLSKIGVIEVDGFSIIASKILNRLNNWQNTNEREINDAIEAIMLLVESKAQGLLTETRFFEKIMGLWEGETVAENIRLAAVILSKSLKFMIFNKKMEVLEKLTRHGNNRKKVLNERVLMDLMRIAVMVTGDLALRKKSVRILNGLFGENPNFYVPGDSRELENLRKFMIDLGIYLLFH